MIDAGTMAGTIKQDAEGMAEAIATIAANMIAGKDMYEDCRRVIDFLDKLTEKKNEGTMSNRILSMYEIMKSASEEGSVRKERPYSNILVPMMENETELRNELADLKDSISDIMMWRIVCLATRPDGHRKK